MKIKSMNFNRLLFLVVTLTITFTAYAGNAHAQLNLDTTFNAGVTDGAADGYVTAAQSDGKILVGGSFSFANGIERNSLVRLNPDGTMDTTFNAGGVGVNDAVFEIIVLPNDRLLIGGNFTSYNGVTKMGIARLNADGSLDNTFNSGGVGLNIGSSVMTIAVQTDGKYLAAGQGIASYNGTARFGVVRLNTDGTLDTSFTTPFTSTQFVEEVALQTAGGKIIIGGFFGLGTPTRRDVARLNTDGSFDNTFNPGGVGTDANGVFALTVQSNDKILIGGGFGSYNGVSRSGIALLNADGSLDTAFVPPTNISAGGGAEYFAIQPDGKILVAGRFMPTAGVFTSIVRLNTNGSLDPTFATPATDNLGTHVRLQSDGKVVLVGLFTMYGTTPRNRIVRLDSTGGIDTSFNASLTGFGFVSSIVQQADGKILVGGNFMMANGTMRTNLVRFNIDGTLDTGFTPSIVNDNSVITLAFQSDGKILIGGNFTMINGSARQGIARLNTNGSLDASFNPTQLTGNAAIAIVNDIIVLPDDRILIGGRFTPGGVFQRLLRLNNNGTIDATFTPGVTNGNVSDILRQPDGKILVGGTFTTTFNGQPRSGIARVNEDGTIDTTFNPGTGTNNFVQKLALQTDGKVLIVGAFTTFNGTSRNRIARLNANGSLDTTFDVGSGADDSIQGVALQSDGKVLIGGNFANYNGVGRNRLARLNSNGSLDTSFVSGLANDRRFFVCDIVPQTDGRILVGGAFNSYNGVTKNSLIRLTTAPPRRTQFDFDGDGRSDISVYRPSNGVWYLQQSLNGFSGFQFGIATDKIVPADFDGDGRTDIAVYRPSNGVWYIQRSSTGFTAAQFGTSEDIPQPADFDGDGKAELVVYRPSNGVWYIFNLVNNQFTAFQFGTAEDQPEVGDYDGDGRADYAVYRPSNGVWYLQQSTSGFGGVQLGISTDKPVAADYDGDGRTDVAVYRPSNGVWYIQQSTAGFIGIQFGIAEDKPSPADYDGDGRADIAVYRPSNGVWYLQRSSSGFTAFQFGIAEDKPIPNAFVRQ